MDTSLQKYVESDSAVISVICDLKKASIVISVLEIQQLKQAIWWFAPNHEGYLG